MKNKELVYWFNRYNRLYFGRKLVSSVRFTKMGRDTLGWCKRCSDGSSKIRLNKKRRKWNRVMRATLLHEMVHAELPANAWHGPRFEARMRKLAKQKALTGLW